MLPVLGLRWLVFSYQQFRPFLPLCDLGFESVILSWCLILSLAFQKYPSFLTLRPLFEEALRFVGIFKNVTCQSIQSAALVVSGSFSLQRYPTSISAQPIFMGAIMQWLPGEI